jgi:hypothetical protein
MEGCGGGGRDLAKCHLLLLLLFFLVGLLDWLILVLHICYGVCVCVYALGSSWLIVVDQENLFFIERGSEIHKATHILINPAPIHNRISFNSDRPAEKH